MAQPTQDHLQSMTEAPINSLWARTATPRDRHAVLPENAKCDVRVVGAGFTGLRAAPDLAQQGRTVAVPGTGVPCPAASPAYAATILLATLTRSLARVASTAGALTDHRIGPILAQRHAISDTRHLKTHARRVPERINGIQRAASAEPKKRPSRRYRDKNTTPHGLFRATQQP